MKLIEDLKNYLLKAPRDGNKKGEISQNTAANYFGTFKTVLKKAFVDGYLTIDLSAKTKGIRGLDSRRETLTIDEINLLVNTPCDKPIVKLRCVHVARHSRFCFSLRINYLQN